MCRKSKIINNNNSRVPHLVCRKVLASEVFLDFQRANQRSEKSRNKGKESSKTQEQSFSHKLLPSSLAVDSIVSHILEPFCRY